MNKNKLTPLLALGSLLGAAFLAFMLSPDDKPNTVDPGEPLQDPPMTEAEADADSTANTISATSANLTEAQILLEKATADANAAIEENQALVEENAALTKDFQTMVDEQLKEGDTKANARFLELSDMFVNQNKKMLATIDSLAEKVRSQGDDTSVDLSGASPSPKYRSGDTVPETSIVDIVWVRPMDGPDGDGESGEGSNRRTDSSTTNAPRGLVGSGAGAATGETGGREGWQSAYWDREPEADAVATAAADENEADEEPIPVYTLPDMSIGLDATTLTDMVGRVYDDGVVKNARPFKALLGRQNFAANYTDLPDEITGMIFEGFVTGDRLMSCVEGRITAASFVFASGEARPAYIGGEGARPASEAYPKDRIGYITNERGNTCILGEYLTNTPEFVATNAAMTALQGYALALQDQDVERVNLADASGTATINNVTGNLGRYAALNGAVSGIEEFNSWLRKRQSESRDAVYVPPGTRISIHLQKTIYLDKMPDGRLISYPQETTRNAFID